MNIKSLLLGSAAALVAVSGARAADAVVAPEPEPVEYVRVCDMYGAGFYYIPGTEVCLKIGGYIQYEIGVGDLFGAVGDTGDDTYWKRGRVAVRFDARTETEYGTLRGYTELRFNYTNDDVAGDYNGRQNGGVINDAYVQLGGFLIGVTDSFYVTWFDYVGDIINDDLIPYGPFTTHTIQYVFDAGNGFSIGAAVEDGSDNDYYPDGAITNYAPNALIGVKYETGIFKASVVGAYAAAEVTNPLNGQTSDGEFAVTGKLDITPSDTWGLFVMGAWTDDDNGDGTHANSSTGAANYYASWGGEWALWAGGHVKASDRVAINALFGYNELEDWAAVANANITVIPGSNGTSIGSFVVIPEVAYKHFDDIDDDQWGGFLRTRFTF